MSANNRIVSIVDDDPDVTMFFHEALRTIAGITIFTFTDPIMALEHFQVNGYAYVAVISDFKMPGLNGMEFLKKIKESNRFVRTILMTAFTIDDNLFQEYMRNDVHKLFKLGHSLSFRKVNTTKKIVICIFSF